MNMSALAEQLEPGTGVVIKYVATDLQAADIFTKALQPLKWDHALKLLGIRTNLPEKLKDVRPEMSKCKIIGKPSLWSGKGPCIT